MPTIRSHALPTFGLCLSLIGALLSPVAEAADPEGKSQYAFEEIEIPGASADEPIREAFSLQAALAYVEHGAEAWTKKKNCVSCHTNGSYLLTRPALTKIAGAPADEIRRFFVEELKELEKEDREKLKKGITPTQIAYIAAGLAEWDEHVTKRRSPETDAALRLMFAVQAADGSFSNEDCWPPLESSNFHGATVAAMAAAAAPGWIEETRAADFDLASRYNRLMTFLRDTAPPHDYARLLLLWVSTQVPDLIDERRKESIVNLIWSHQQRDGG